VQGSAGEYCLRKEEVKRMLQLAAVTERNINLLVDECFNQLRLRDDAVFYYEFLSILQWLAVTVISTDKEEDLDSHDQEALLIVEKIKFLILKLQPA
jgi:hypothetical protein